jgi:hypothetical protein
MSGAFTGGCQCGRVRYSTPLRPSDPHLCFCRMCQKAVGNYFVALGSVPNAELTMTRGEPSWFNSSDLVRRGFCPHCGTPLFYQGIGDEWTAIVLGSLDSPEAVPPEWQSDTYGKTSWFSGLDTLPESIGSETPEEQTARYRQIKHTNHQHPDHDTETWPPKDRA